MIGDDVVYRHLLRRSATTSTIGKGAELADLTADPGGHRHRRGLGNLGRLARPARSAWSTVAALADFADATPARRAAFRPAVYAIVLADRCRRSACCRSSRPSTSSTSSTSSISAYLRGELPVVPAGAGLADGDGADRRRPSGSSRRALDRAAARSSRGTYSMSIAGSTCASGWWRWRPRSRSRRCPRSTPRSTCAAWYRLMGAKIGKGAEISTNLPGRYDLDRDRREKLHRRRGGARRRGHPPRLDAP